MREINGRKWATTKFMSTLALLMLLSGSVALAQQTQTTVQANGAFANAEYAAIDASGTITAVSVEAFRNEQQGSTTTFVFLDEEVVNFTTGTFSALSAFGALPNNAFLVTPSRASLNIDISKLDFVSFCTGDFVTCIPSAPPATGVNLVWTALPISGQSNGSAQSTFFGTSITESGTKEDSEALANGTFAGAVITSAQGQIGTNHNATITITHH
jgi:hypothetical protein